MITEINAIIAAVPSHASSHQNSGSDEINVAGLSGLLADPQTPISHNNTYHSTNYEAANANIQSHVASPGEDVHHAKTHNNTEHSTNYATAAALTSHTGASNPHSGSAGEHYLDGSYHSDISLITDAKGAMLWQEVSGTWSRLTPAGAIGHVLKCTNVDGTIGFSQLAHGALSSSGTKTHSQIDSHITAGNPHSAHVDTFGNESIAGIKTFSSIPVLPASDPTTVNQATRKSYVDNKVLGTYKIWIATYPDRASNLNGAGGSYGGGSGRYVYGNAASPSLEWNLSQYMPNNIIGHSVVLNTLIAYWWKNGAHAATLKLIRRKNWSTDANRAESIIASDNTFTLKESAYCYELSVAPDHTLLDDYHYYIYIDGWTNTSNLRLEGIYLEFEVT